MPLQAKSAGDRRTLLEHTADVESAAKRLREIWPALPAELETAARFHDMGKAASGFQAMLDGGARWDFRHEVLSAAIFADRFDLEDPNWRRAYLALLCHHKNLGGHKIGEAFQRCSSFFKYSRWFGHWAQLDVARLKQEFAPDLDNWNFDPKLASPANAVGEWMQEIQPVFQDLQTMRMRGALVASDHLASAGLGVAMGGEAISRARLEANVAVQLAARGGAFTGWKTMQNESAQTVGSALMIAPTGAGKTEAALLWALNNRRGAERIFYVLPYQVSINAMAKRLGELFPGAAGKDSLGENSNLAVVHANSDLAYLQEHLRDDATREEVEKLARTAKNAARQLYAPLKITTVYQLLNLFFGRKFFEVGLLELSDSLVVFDEIHAYDGHTLGLIVVLLEYLHQLGARVFIMTATLPEVLKDELRRAAHIPDGAEIVLPADDPLLLEARRQIKVSDGKIEDSDTIAQIEDALEKGLKVAVVCNTVRKAILMSRLLQRHSPYLVHSRFTLGDRARREQKEEIEAKYLVVATQVIEVSLDVSFGAMWTELAPADALLQRFGRVNRHGDGKEAATVTLCCGEDAGSQMVYDGELLSATANWAREFEQSDAKLTFGKSLEWMQAVYPLGLSAAENAAKDAAHDGFASVVAELKPMLDPNIDPDLEMTLFETVQVVPGRFEKQWREAVLDKQYMRAKELLVNVNLRSWLGADKNAQRIGLEGQRKITDLGDNWKMTVALFRYTNDDREGEACLGLDLEDPRDESTSNSV